MYTTFLSDHFIACRRKVGNKSEQALSSRFAFLAPQLFLFDCIHSFSCWICLICTDSEHVQGFSTIYRFLSVLVVRFHYFARVHTPDGIDLIEMNFVIFTPSKARFLIRLKTIFGQFIFIWDWLSVARSRQSGLFTNNTFGIKIKLPVLHHRMPM